jgi:hypothetical protein
VIPHRRPDGGSGLPALQFEQSSADGAPPEVVAAAGVPEAPADPAGIVDGAIGRAGGDERARAAVSRQ